MTPQSLLLEAQYYNLTALEHDIVACKPPPDPVKYLCCILQKHPYDPGESWIVDLACPLSEETAKANHGLDLLKYLYKGDHSTEELQEEILSLVTEGKEWRYPEMDGYSWVICSATGGGANGPPVVVLKGQRK